MTPSEIIPGHTYRSKAGRVRTVIWIKPDELWGQVRFQYKSSELLHETTLRNFAHWAHEDITASAAVWAEAKVLA